jgi:hypothetical protein
MLVCVGYDVDFELESSRVVRAPENAAMLYDKTGHQWPYTSLVVVPFRRLGKKAERGNRFAKAWFGRSYDLLEGSAAVPDRDMTAWREVGPVLRVFYTRGSGDQREARRAGDYEHDFSIRGPFDFFTFRRPKLPMLYRRGAALRLEIARDYAVTAAGIS